MKKILDVILRLSMSICLFVVIGTIANTFLHSPEQAIRGIVVICTSSFVYFFTFGTWVAFSKTGAKYRSLPKGKERALFLLEETALFPIWTIFLTLMFFKFFGIVTAISFLIFAGISFTPKIFKKLDQE